MTDLNRALRDAKELRQRKGSVNPKFAKEVGKAIGKGLDTERAQRENEKKKYYDHELEEIGKYHTRRASKNPTYFFFRGGGNK